ncbi:hypothetical protein B296_00007132 [Ensete ventricosum]|uniref:Uncharacterized protein n=1 Tax=Ensete ventricosum TaxID=4639 RepID=A0A426YU55_ENSVE|nr:hypothetical protein B296_00007132 [Ensete ventricosum]
MIRRAWSIRTIGYYPFDRSGRLHFVRMEWRRGSARHPSYMRLSTALATVAISFFHLGSDCTSWIASWISVLPWTDDLAWVSVSWGEFDAALTVTITLLAANLVLALRIRSFFWMFVTTGVAEWSCNLSLVKLLPSGTVLAFQALAPPFSNRGACLRSNRYLTAALIHLCAAACALLSLTDSLRGCDGKLYYGIATLGGLHVVNYEGEEGERGRVLRDLRRYRLRVRDGVHAVLGVVMFLAVAFSDADVVECFFPDVGAEVRQLLVNLPLGAGLVASVVFVMFPTTRKGVSYADTAHHTELS